jgi:hypothetical protein
LFIVIGGIAAGVDAEFIIGVSIALAGVLGIPAGLYHVMRKSRVSREVASLESEVANMERDQDNEILLLTDRVGVAQSGKRALGNLRPTRLIWAAQV